MNLLISLLPIYIFGNLHCAGMCGPLVMLLSKHRYRWWYFLGRLCAFSLAGVISAEIGMLLFSTLSKTHFSAILSLLFGAGIMGMGVCLILRIRFPTNGWLAKKLGRFALQISTLMTKPSASAIFLFGACTLLLPCGQTILVYSLLALNGAPLAGLLNGFLFALITSPALIAAMHASHLFRGQKKHFHLWMGGAALFAGALAILRGFADLSIIQHLTINSSAPSQYHIVFF